MKQEIVSQKKAEIIFNKFEEILSQSQVVEYVFVCILVAMELALFLIDYIQIFQPQDFYLHKTFFFSVSKS